MARLKERCWSGSKPGLHLMTVSEGRRRLPQFGASSPSELCGARQAFSPLGLGAGRAIVAVAY